MKELTKVNNNLFNEYFEGINGSKKVTCILDDNCVRYMVFVQKGFISKRVSRHEYTNDHKTMCLKKLLLL